MSTRTTIVIEDHQGLPVAAFYRHHDGYLGGTGLDLSDTLADWLSGRSPFHWLATHVQIGVGAKYRGQPLEPVAYDRLAGDLEYIYTVRPTVTRGMSGTTASVRVNVRRRLRDGSWAERDLSYAEFEAICKADRKAIDERLAAMEVTA